MTTRRVVFQSLVTFILFVLFGCQPDASSSSPPANAVRAIPAVAAAASTDLLSDLLTSMEVIGPEGTARFNATLTAFLADPNATARLRAHIRSVPHTQPDLRRRIAFLAAQIRTPDIVDFLKELALSPPDVWQLDDGERRDANFAVRNNAAIGLAKNFAASIEGADAAVSDVFETADDETARLMALELFGDGNLRDSWRAQLESRGVRTAFRRLTDDELAKVREVHPDMERHVDEDTQQHTESVSVPIEMGME